MQAKQHELERQQQSDNLRKHLEKRPDREELVERKTSQSAVNITKQALNELVLGNILPESTAAPALLANQRSLEKHMRADSLEQKIQQRPKPDQLVKEGILEADEDPLKE